MSSVGAVSVGVAGAPTTRNDRERAFVLASEVGGNFVLREISRTLPALAGGFGQATTEMGAADISSTRTCFTRVLTRLATLRFTTTRRLGFAATIRFGAADFRTILLSFAATLSFANFFRASFDFATTVFAAADFVFRVAEDFAAKGFGLLTLVLADERLAADWMAGMAFLLFVPGNTRFMRNVG